MKRLNVLVAALLVFALSPLAGALAFANDGNTTSGASGAGATGRAANDATAVADPSTMNSWQERLSYSTSDIGRIWTDKSVSTESLVINDDLKVDAGTSAFVTALSALSSTSNTSSTATTPLDIVLVLDASKSMDSDLGRGTARTKRIEALRSAANAFIDEIAKQNDGISDPSLQHQVSIVKFAGSKSESVGNETYESGGYTYNYSQVMKTMSPCTDVTSADFKKQVESIVPNGCTRSDCGLELAKDQTSGRTGENGGIAAKKIVVFFTDGKPTNMSDFEDAVASPAVAAASSMKAAGASVYAIGIFDGANPTSDPTGRASQENKFMQAVSSNYPDATYEAGWPYTWKFGERAKDADFYKSATNADDLKKVFEDISKEIVQGAGYPTKTTEGAEFESGFITLDDPLGAYMQVDDVSAIVVNGVKYDGKTVTHDGNVTTYRFNQAVTINGSDVNLDNIDITVTKSNDASVGDAVQVKIPAAMIPLRNFNVDENEMKMSVTNTDPLTVFYTSSLKSSVSSLLADPDDAMKTYLEKSTKDGVAPFYANAWSGGSLGDVMASFEPSPKNEYYYFTRDVPIYTDKMCTQRAKTVTKGETYWYKHDFYEVENGSSSGGVTSGTAASRSVPVSFPGETAEQFNGAIGTDADGAFFKAGTARLTYINELRAEKANNVTETASDVLNPKWNDTSATAAATMVQSHLGNNGKLSVELPGTLAVTKHIQVPDGYTAADFANDEFAFTISIPEAADKTFAAKVTDAQDEVVAGAATTITFDKGGNATCSLKPSQTLHVLGLSGGSSYTVKENGRTGWEQVDASGTEGRIAAGQTSTVAVTNKYTPKGVLNGSDALKGTKTVTGRDWKDADRFVFELKAASTSPDAPMPNNTVSGVTPAKGTAYVELAHKDGEKNGNPVGFSFANIEYSKPGTYMYELWESEEASNSLRAQDGTGIQPGVSASQALYRIVVQVSDKEHNGTLTVESVMTKLADDEGKRFSGAQVQTVQSADFVNVFDTDTTKWTPSGTKTYSDMTGAYGFTQGMFNVAACTDDPAAPLPSGEGVETFEYEYGGKTWRGVVTAVEEGGSIAFPQATYGFNEAGRDFTYRIVEVVKGSDGKWAAVKSALQGPDYQLDGMKYDPSVWMVKVSVQDSKGALVLRTQYFKDGVSQGDTQMFSFANTYEPTAAKATIAGAKTLTGRDMLEGESFGFALEATNDAAKTVLPDGKQVTLSGLKDGVEQAFDFGELSFAKPGMYTFKMIENAYAGDASKLQDGVAGITFDHHECAVTVTVTDDHDGALKAQVAYKGKGSVADHPEKFANAFNESVCYGDVGGLAVVKTLTGRDMAAGEFSFAIKGADDASEALLSDADRSFANHARAAGLEDEMRKLVDLKFSAADVGKTFTFQVSEVEPPDGQKLAGVTYDAATHEVQIAVSVRAEGRFAGHLAVTTKVDGVPVSVIVPDDQGVPTAYACDAQGNIVGDGAQVAGASAARVAFTNAYEADDVSFDTAQAGLRKVLEGRDWVERLDSYTFAIEALDGGPLPCDAAGNEVRNVTVTSENAGKFSFGTMTFTSDMVAQAPGRTKTFTYRVTEVVPATAEKLPGIEYSTNVATIKVTVRDDGTGALKASAVTENGTFVNRYATEIDYTAAGGLNVAKTLTGRDMADGQFQIRVTPNDEASAKALSLPLEGTVVSMPAAADGQQAVKQVLGSNVVLRQDDVGQTYTYTVAELGEAPAGYTYDTAKRTVTITVADDPSAGALTVTTVVSGGPEGKQTFTYPKAAGAGAAVVPFANSYFASTDVPGGAKASVNATKALTGRPLAAGEFSFAVKYATGDEGDLLSATNAADGTVTFGSLSYDTKTLAELVKGGHATKAVLDGKTQWTVSYLAYEKTDGLADIGVTAKTQPMPFTVTVVDNGDGTLTATANVGEGLTFENAYATSDPAVVNLTGVKALQAETGLQPADITGKFTFVVTSDDLNAPLPERTSVTNGANGSVDFGAITFTLDDLNRALGVTSGNAADDAKVAAPRSYTFVYKVTESGEVPGVTNDPAATKTVSIKVTDDGKGNLTAERVGDAKDPAFAFTNTYTVEPQDSSVTDQVTVTKALTGRAMAAGEFSFELLEGDQVVATGVNDAAGSVTLSAVTYTEPGTYRYVLREVGAGTVAAGVTYDGATFAVTTTVVDNGDGTLGVTHELDGSDAAAFANVYQPQAASVVLGASKTLTGKTLEKDQFTFLLTAADGTVVRAKNAADGTVTFPALTFAKPGTYEFTLSELNDAQENVTYDKRTYQVTVTVVDDLQGHLNATVTSDNDALTFENAYVEPPTPQQPSDTPGTNAPPKSTTGKAVVQTGDNAMLLAAPLAVVAFAGVAAIVALCVMHRRQHH